MLKFVLDLFFPPVCGICGKLNKNWLCSECKENLNKIKKTTIIKTFGKKYEEFGFLFLYKDIRNTILEYKFNNKAYLSNMFTNIILDDEIISNYLKEYDMIIPVPMSKKKKAKRGYNQTELIAKEVARNLGLEYNSNSLVKIKNNKTQSTLSEKDRFENVKNVYTIVNEDLIKNKKVILFDDILTTGATVDECARLLKKHNTNKILVLTLAKD